MNKLIVALGLLLSTSAFAANAAPKPNGNTARAAVLKAVGAKTGRVVALETAGLHVKGIPALESGRISVVQHTVGETVQISYAKIKEDGTATKLSARQVKALGLNDDASAIAQARLENGRIDGKPSAALKVEGLSKYGGSIKIVENQKARGSSYNLHRYVPLTAGRGGRNGRGRTSTTY